MEIVKAFKARKSKEIVSCYLIVEKRRFRISLDRTSIRSDYIADLKG